MNADRVIASLKPAFLACYARSDSRASGLIVVRANTTGSGAVESAEIVSNAGLPSSVAQCAADRVKEASFGAPGGTGVSVLVPVPLGR